MLAQNLEKDIEDMYLLSEIDVFPLSILTIIILITFTMLIFFGLFYRYKYLKNNPWILELRNIKSNLISKETINMQELSITLKQIAKLKYKNYSFNKMEIEELIRFVDFKEEKTNFLKIISPYFANIYNQNEIDIGISDFINIKKNIKKWI